MEPVVSQTEIASESDKTALILTAAAQVLSRHGYAGATITRVAEEAGVSRGLLHYYFRNKEDMLAKVLQNNMGEGGKILDDIFRASSTAEHFAERLTAVFRDMYKAKHEFFTLFMEGISVSRQSETIMEQMSAMYREFRLSLQKHIEAVRECGIIESGMSAKSVASLITGLLDGLGLQLLLTPDMEDDNELWKSLEQGILILVKGEA